VKYEARRITLLPWRTSSDSPVAMRASWQSQALTPARGQRRWCDVVIDDPLSWHRVEQIVQAALARPGAERAAFLQEQCGNELGLRTEVEELLRAHAEAGSFLDHSPIENVGILERTARAIEVGERLGPYEILQWVGAGGMGEVYKARDTRLGRTVAVKVLSLSLRTHRDLRERFEREARALAALNHPHICPVFDIGRQDDIDFLVMEYLEGSTLADRIAKGALPVAEALTIATQIGDALDAAHGQNIIHRDLKPANINIAPDGAVKVLDFGLAKVHLGQGGGAASQSSDNFTRDGVVLGTVAYMSPEQARGKPVDERTDIWAFGCVLYEMLTGQVPFAGDTSLDAIAAILEHQPDWHKLPKGVSASVRDLLKHCLAKETPRRLRDIGDARFALEQRFEVEPAGSAKSSVRWKLTAAIATVATAAVLIAWWPATRLPNRSPLRLPLDLGADAVEPSTGPSAILSPDGTRLVYRRRNPGGTIQLFIRALDTGEATALAGTDNAWAPFFSPDGQSIGFFDTERRKLRKISLNERQAVDLSDALYARGGSWGDDGNIIASTEFQGPLYRIPSGGGTPEAITELRQAVTHRWPQVLPGAQAVIFTANKLVADFDQATIEIQSLKTGERKTLVDGGYYGRYVPTGHLLYLHNETLYAVPIDVVRQKVTGTEVPLIKDVRTRVGSGGAAFDVSASGALVYAAGGPVKYKLAWLDPTARIEMLPGRGSVFNFTLRFSPDGSRLALSIGESGNRDVWVYQWQRDAWTRLTSASGPDGYPVWTRDGTHIAFFRSLRASDGIFWTRADGTGEPVQLTASKNPIYPYSISPTGQYLAFNEQNPQTKGDIWVLPLHDAHSDRPKVGDATPFLNTGFDEVAPMISPDGRWIAYQSDETGANEIYVRTFPGPGGKWTISTGGGSQPVWAKNQPQLFYRGSEGIMAVTYKESGGAFEPGRPRLWVARKGLSQWFDVSPDGKRVVIIENDRSEDTSATPLTFVLNFFDELRRRIDDRR
jgi:serine/threonine protein kinase/Tol biopolymer transport system component